MRQTEEKDTKNLNVNKALGEFPQGLVFACFCLHQDFRPTASKSVPPKTS